MTSVKLISVIIPCFNEQSSLGPFFSEISAVLNKQKYNFELIFVNDGSSDETGHEILSFKSSKKINIIPLELSRNFGKEVALAAGLKESRGEAAILIDADLQHPVAKIPEFLEEWQKGADVVIGVRKASGHSSFLKKAGSRVFYKLMNMISETEIIPNSTDFRLLDRAVVDAYNQFTERRRITRGLIDWLGFKRKLVYFDANERKFGQPSYGYKQLTHLAVYSMVAYSQIPLKIAGYLGAVLTLLAGSLGLFVLVEQIILRDPLNLRFTGTAMISIVLVLVCGIILICLGLISIYLGMIHAESQNRPLYIIKRRRQ